MPRHEGHGRQVLERRGRGKQEPLAGDAAEREQGLRLGLRLDPLGNRVDAERVAEAHHGARQLGSVALGHQAEDERAIDLQHVDREPVQVGKRGVARPEVVDREPDTERLQLPQPLEVGLGVVHHRALGQLDDEVRRREPRLLQRPGDVPLELALLQVTARDVQGDVQALVGHPHLVAPAAPVLAGPLQHEAPELDDVTRFLGQLDELPRHQHAALGVPPARERLAAEQRARAERDDRLVLEEELAVGQRAADVGLEAQALAQRLLHVRLEHDVAILAGGFGVVHRDVGVAQQILGCALGRRERHAHADADLDVGLPDHERHAERFDQLGGGPLDIRQPVDAFEQDGELVARQPRHGIGGAHGADQPLRHRLQQPIARVVAERVVDVLEVVEVEEHDRHVAARAAGQRERVLDAIAEQVPVGEPGQRIVKRQLPQLLFEALALADVAQVERQALHRRIGGQVAADDLEREALLAALDQQLDRANGAGRRGRDLREEYLQPLAILTRPQAEQVAADDVVGLHAERALERRRGELQGAVLRDDQDDVRGIRDERRVSRLDQFLRPPLADPRIVAQHGALAEHDEQRDHEDDDRHLGHRAGDLRAGDVDEHDEGHEHRAIRQRPRQWMPRRRTRADRRRGGAQLAACGDRDAAGSTRRTSRPGGRRAGSRRRPSRAPTGCRRGTSW